MEVGHKSTATTGVQWCPVTLSTRPTHNLSSYPGQGRTYTKGSHSPVKGIMWANLRRNTPMQRFSMNKQTSLMHCQIHHGTDEAEASTTQLTNDRQDAKGTVSLDRSLLAVPVYVRLASRPLKAITRVHEPALCKSNSFQEVTH